MGQGRIGRRLAVATAVVAVLAASCTGDDAAAFAGSCFEEPPRDPSADAEVACEDARYEIVAVDHLEGGDDAAWPGDTELTDATFRRCLDAAEEYVGAPLPDHDLDLWFHHPSEDAWRDDDRRFVCAVSRIDEGPLGGSVAEMGDR